MARCRTVLRADCTDGTETWSKIRFAEVMIALLARDKKLQEEHMDTIHKMQVRDVLRRLARREKRSLTPKIPSPLSSPRSGRLIRIWRELRVRAC